MDKNTMHDMVPNDKRSIRHVPIERKAPPHTEKRRARKLPPHPRRLRKEGSSQRFWAWLIGGIVVIVLIGIVMLFSFAAAEISVTPKHEAVQISGEFEAHLGALSPDLPFEVVTVTQSRSQTVTATGEEEVHTKARGDIVVFNDFDESPQRLIANTRFRSSEGFIYRIDEAITVPGRHENEDGEMVPGSIEVTVYADEAGEAYNTDLTDFDIPGFE